MSLPCLLIPFDNHHKNGDLSSRRPHMWMGAQWSSLLSNTRWKRS